MPKKMNHTIRGRATRSRNPKTLLNTSITYLLRVKSAAKPSSKAGPKWAVTIEYKRLSALIPGVQNGYAGAYDAACKVVAVRMKSGLRVTGRFPHMLTDPLFSASSAEATNEKMAKAFFGALKRRGEVILVEKFDAPAPAPAPAPAAPAPALDAQYVEEGEAELERLWAAHAGTESWTRSMREAQDDEEAWDDVAQDEAWDHVAQDEAWDDDETASELGLAADGVAQVEGPRKLKKPERYADAIWTPGANNQHCTGREIDPGRDVDSGDESDAPLAFLPPELASTERADIDRLRWEMWVEAPSEEESDGDE
jgi:hypothetical protein